MAQLLAARMNACSSGRIMMRSSRRCLAGAATQYHGGSATAGSGSSSAPMRCSRRRLAVQAAAAAASAKQQGGDGPQYGIFVCSGSPSMAEAVGMSGVDWMCIDAQHGPVGYEALANLLAATTHCPAKRIVRVGGPTDRFGMQQALDLGADGVMVPLINTRAEAEAAVAFCKFPPQGCRSLAYPTRASYPRGIGAPAVAAFLQDANHETEVWLQVETKDCFEDIDNIFSVPGIHCGFLGPVDMGLSLGLNGKYNNDLAAMLASPDMDGVYTKVVSACAAKGIKPGVFCLGQTRAQQLVKQGFAYAAFDVDLSITLNYASSAMKALRPA